MRKVLDPIPESGRRNRAQGLRPQRAHPLPSSTPLPFRIQQRRRRSKQRDTGSGFLPRYSVLFLSAGRHPPAGTRRSSSSLRGSCASGAMRTFGYVIQAGAFYPGIDAPYCLRRLLPLTSPDNSGFVNHASGEVMQGTQHSSRPVSPHATIYRFPLNAVLSILHRITGVALVVGGALVVWWFLAASISRDYFGFVDGLMTTILGDLVMLGCLAALSFHLCNGLRHLVWDSGAGFSKRNVNISAFAGMAGAAIIFLAFFALANS